MAHGAKQDALSLVKLCLPPVGGFVWVKFEFRAHRPLKTRVGGVRFLGSCRPTRTAEKTPLMHTMWYGNGYTADKRGGVRPENNLALLVVLLVHGAALFDLALQHLLREPVLRIHTRTRTCTQAGKQANT